MKILKVIGLVTVLLAIIIVPAWADFGTTVSSVTVQNTGTDTATISFTFYDETGTEVFPDPLVVGPPEVANPFTLEPGESYELYMPSANLADGKYSLVISSDQPVVAVSNVIRDYSGTGYNGTFAGFAAGADTIYMPSIVYEYYGYNSELSVQNTGAADTDITIDYACPTGVYSDTAAAVGPGASAHFDLANNPPTGLPSNSACSATVMADEPVVAIDNQYNQAGFLQTYNGFLAGADVLNVTALYNGYYGWASSLDIQNVGITDTVVTVAYSDGDDDSTCALAAGDKCQLYMPTVKSLATTLFAATISSDGEPLVAVHNAAHASSLAQTSNAISAGGMTASIPVGYNDYYGWNSSWACVNMSATDATTLTVSYDGYGTYDIADLAAGDSVEVYVPADADGPTAGNRAAVTILSSAADIACTYNANQGALVGTGDWSLAGNAFSE
jgi:hypothetical protein